MSPPDETVSVEVFLRALWPDGELPGHLVVWTKTKAGRANNSDWCSGIEEAATVAMKQRRQRDVYFGVALQDMDRALAIARHRDPEAQARSVRGSSASSVAIPGLWVDIDIEAEAHASKELPPTVEAALELLDVFGLQPSLIVHSGYGLHVYWLFREPWLLESDEEHQDAEVLAQGLQQVLRSEAQRRGWTLDSTADLARVLRLPGTLNHKGAEPKPVEILHFEPERRYNPSEIRGLLPREAPSATRSGEAKSSKRADEFPANLKSIRAECAWMEHCYQDQASLPEPEWYALLSIISRCEEDYQSGRELAHAWSQGHSGYSAAETDRKLDQALRASGPRTCDNIANELGGFQAFCSKCQHRQRVTSPIQLGHMRGSTQVSPYRATPQGFVFLKDTREGPVPVPLTNFTARIVSDVLHDDGAETSRSLELEADHEGQLKLLTVAAGKFVSMAWILDELGPTAILNAGFGIKDHTRVAIQAHSEGLQTRTVFRHLGWRVVDGQAFYLHAGGAIGTVGTVPGIEVDLPEALSLFALPDPPEAEKLKRCIRASLEILELLPDAITIPLYSAIWRAAIGSCDFALHLAGHTGEGKTEFVALDQQHYGTGLDARHLPGSWSSTGNALEGLAFAAKDALLVVDDFAPEGSASDVQRQHKEAARLLRAQGNRSGRQRMRADASLRPIKAPRGLILSTGEDIPKAQSIRARMLTLEVPIGGMDWGKLTLCQQDAAAGLYSQALAGFVQWLAAGYPGLEDLKRRRLAALRQQADRSSTSHKRTPALVAELGFGMETFLEFSREVEALSAAEATVLWERTWTALGQAAADQAEHLAAEDPVRRFLELLRSAISSGNAHFVDLGGERPRSPERFGWRCREGHSVASSSSWAPQGLQVGWVEDSDLFLDPTTALRAAQQMATSGGIAMTDRTLWKRMRERGLLTSWDSKRTRNTIRKMLQGSRREVLHLATETLLPQKPSQPSQPSHEDRKGPENGTVQWDCLDSVGAEPSHRTVPGPPEEQGLEGRTGTVGTVGTVLGVPGTVPDGRRAFSAISEKGGPPKRDDFMEF